MRELPATPRPGPAVALAVLTTVMLVAIAEEARVRRPPLPDEVLAGALPATFAAGRAWFDLHAGRVTVAVLAIVAGVLAALAAGLSARVRLRAGVFGVVAAAGTAAGSTCALHGPLTAANAGAAVGPLLAVAVGLCGAVIAPWLRERGTLSLVVVSLALAVPTVVARRQAMVEQVEAVRFMDLRRAVVETGLTRLVLAMPEDTPPSVRLALARSLWPPLETTAVQIAGVVPDSDEERLLVAAGWSGLRLGDEHAQPLGDAAALPPAPEPFGRSVQLRPLDAQGPVVVATPPDGALRLRVVTPAGTVRQELQDPRHGARLWGDALDRYRALVAALPAGMTIWVRIEEGPGAPGSAWLAAALP